MNCQWIVWLLLLLPLLLMRLVLVWVSWCGLRCCHCLAHLCTCCLWAVGHSAVNFQDAQVHSAYPITHRSTQPILLHRPLFLPHNRLLNQSGQVNGQRNRLFFFSVHSSCNSSVHSSVNFFPTICPSTQPLTQPDRLSKRTKICPVLWSWVRAPRWAIRFYEITVFCWPQKRPQPGPGIKPDKRDS